MVPLYVALLAGLAGVWRVLAGRAGRLERKYVTAARQADEANRLLTVKAGNGKADPLAAARRQYELGRLVQVRDRLSDKYMAAQGRADAMAHRLRTLTGAKGRAVPYLLGLIDAGLAAAAVAHSGLSVADLRALLA
jgi:hypothetical protein